MNYIAIFGLSFIGMMIFTITTRSIDQIESMPPRVLRIALIGIPAAITFVVWATETLIN